MSAGAGGEGKAPTRVPPPAVVWGVVGQLVYLVALFLVPEAPSVRAASPAMQAASPVLIAASGAVGGQMAGHVARVHGGSPVRSAAAATALGGAGLAALLWWFFVTPGAVDGVFWSLAYALATNPAVPAAVVPPGFGAAVLCVGVATARLPDRWDGSLVGRRE